MRAIVPLDGEPPLESVSVRPPARGPGAPRRGRRRARPLPDKGPASTAQSPSATASRVTGRSSAGTAAAEAMVVFAEPTQAYRLGFALGVQLFVERAEGLTLFQQRGLDRTRPALVDGLRLGGLVLGAAARRGARGRGGGDQAREGGRPRASARSRSSSATTPAPRSSSTTARSSREGAEPEPNFVKVAGSSGLPPRPTWAPRCPQTPLLLGGARALARSPGGPHAEVTGCYVRSSGPSPPVTFCHQSSSRRFSSP